jgi:hypothetical protein
VSARWGLRPRLSPGVCAAWRRSRISLVSLAAVGALAALACEPPKASEGDAAPVASTPPTTASAAPSASADDPAARMARWEEARSAAVRIPCRAIAVDGPVHEQGAGDAGAALAQQGEIPTGVWLSLAQSARLVAKDPRTTRETAFVGPALVQVCVAHREESWLATGRFESAIGAGETPGAEEWVVTPLGVIRYMAAKVAVDVRAKDAVVGVGSGVAFMWLDDGVHATVRAGPGADAGAGAGAGPRVDAGAGLDDDGWQRVSDGEVTLSPAAARAPAAAARAIVDRCTALSKRSQDLAATLLAGSAAADGSTAKEQMRTRRQARAACAVAALRVDTLPPSAPKGAMSAQLEGASGAWAAAPAASSPP